MSLVGGKPNKKQPVGAKHQGKLIILLGSAGFPGRHAASLDFMEMLNIQLQTASDTPGLEGPAEAEHPACAVFSYGCKLGF